jgi:hypothetical protein
MPACLSKGSSVVKCFLQTYGAKCSLTRIRSNADTKHKQKEKKRKFLTRMYRQKESLYCHSHSNKKLWNPVYLGSLDRDDSVESPGGVVKEGDVDGGGGRCQPGPLGLRVDVENVRFASENRLLPANTK